MLASVARLDSTPTCPGCPLCFFMGQAQRLFRDRLADSESRTRFDGMLNAQLRSVWSHTADLAGVRGLGGSDVFVVDLVQCSWCFVVFGLVPSNE